MKPKEDFQISGYHQKIENSHQIVLLPTDAINLFNTFLHEIGHALAESNILESHEVLSQAEVQHAKIQLSKIEFARLILLMAFPQVFKNLQMSGMLRDIADRILNVYTKGKWGKLPITVLHNSGEKIDSDFTFIAQENLVTTHTVLDDGKLTPIYTQQGRNAELPAMATQQDCMQILANSTGFYFTYPNLSAEEAKTSHARAARLAEYLHRRERRSSWRVPFRETQIRK